jgi:predicted permease
VTHDLRYAIRALRRTPGFAIAVILCLSLGIGANTAIFSLLDAVLLRPLPVGSPHELVVLQTLAPGGRRASSFSYPSFRFVRERAESAADLFAYGRISINLSAPGMTDRASGLLVSRNYFSALRVQPAKGGAFTAEDDATVVLSDRYWRARFSGDSRVVGRPMTLNGVLFTIVGVAPAGFFGTVVGDTPDLFVPLDLRDRLTNSGPRLAQANSFWLTVMARLTPGVTMERAQAEIAARHREYVQQMGGTVSPGLRRFLEQRRIELASGARGDAGIRSQFQVPLFVLMAAVCMVLLIACANIATLLLARATAREREMAVRLAIGATRGRLVRQLLSESAVLSAAGGALGLLLGVWSANALTAFLTDRVLEVSLDLRILTFTIVASVAAAALFAVAPAFRATRMDLTVRSAGSFRRAGPGRLLIPAQVALSLTLLMGAGLFVRTLANLRALDKGFHGDDVVIATLDPGLSRYTPERAKVFFDELLERAARLPGVTAAAVADAPLLGGTYIDGVGIDGKEIETALKLVGPGFFETMGVAVHAGRDFSAADSPQAPRVAIVTEAVARRYLGGRDPIGVRVTVDGAKDVEIVGVIADTRYRGLREATMNIVYLPIQQARAVDTERTLHARTTNIAATVAALRQLIGSMDGSLPSRVRPFAAVVDATLVQERLIAALSTCFAGLALLLTSIGLYGIIAHGVQRRTREIGIRMSLGARRGVVLWSVLRESLVLVAPGLCLGGILSFWLLRMVASQLFGISPADPATAAGAAVVLVAVAGFAGYVPARRASRLDPAVALRDE